MARKTWTPEDENKLRKIWPGATKEDLVATFPGRKFTAIQAYAYSRGLGSRVRGKSKGKASNKENGNSSPMEIVVPLDLVLKVNKIRFDT